MAGKDSRAFKTALALVEGDCPERPDGIHCDCWWDCKPCCACGFDGGGEGCDCERHQAARSDQESR